MMIKVRSHVVIAAIIVFIVGSCISAKKEQTVPLDTPSSEDIRFPEPVGSVNDFEAILSEPEEAELEKIIKAHEVVASDQIVIVTVASIEPYSDIDQYSLDLANEWGCGQKEKNNGILIAVSRHLRAMRIQNGHGIENRLTDGETKSIIDSIMIPRFKQGDYYQGLKNGVEAIVDELH